jgi:hypothetical protein
MFTPGHFGVLSGILQIASFWFMIRPVAWPGPGRERQQPHRVSWLGWAALYQVMWWSSLARGATGSLWIVGAEVIGTVIMLGLAIRWGTGSLRLVQVSRSRPWITTTSWPDLLVLFGTAAALAGWQATSSPSLGIILTVAADTISALPLIGLLLRRPRTVSLAAWSVSGLASLAAVWSVSPGQPLVLYLYPAAGLALDVVVVAAIFAGHQATRAGLAAGPRHVRSRAGSAVGLTLPAAGAGRFSQRAAQACACPARAGDRLRQLQP